MTKNKHFLLILCWSNRHGTLLSNGVEIQTITIVLFVYHLLNHSLSYDCRLRKKFTNGNYRVSWQTKINCRTLFSYRVNILTIPSYTTGELILNLSFSTFLTKLFFILGLRNIFSFQRIFTNNAYLTCYSPRSQTTVINCHHPLCLSLFGSLLKIVFQDYWVQNTKRYKSYRSFKKQA